MVQAISGCKMMGATKIIGVDINEMKREKGEAFGMTHFINPSDSNKSAVELVKELSDGMGVDYSFECTEVKKMVILTSFKQKKKLSNLRQPMFGITVDMLQSRSLI
jgi:S-(hydroxymethyl)glutathione dehydrogenase/alcohol dehydrogenase